MTRAPTTTVWDADPHTLAKHRILRKYLDRWVPTLAQSLSGRGRVVIIDGFAGPGEYRGGEDGSPIIALKSVIEHRDFRRFPGEFAFLFVEEDEERCAYLENVAIPRLGSLPPNVKKKVVCSKFDETIHSVLDSVEGRGTNLAPSFAFIDPFGFSDTPMSVVGRLLRQPRAEVLITAMLEDVNRFVTHPNPRVLDRFDQLFGNDEWRDLVRLPNRMDLLGDLYKRCLLANGASKVWAFRMIDIRNKPIYDLFFGTKHIEGLKKMKQAMWSVDPGGGFRFSDRAATDQNLVLFEPEPDLSLLRQQLCRTFSGQEKTYSEIERWVLLETPYHDGHIKTKCLKVLEQEERIEYLGSMNPGQRRRKKGTFADPLGRIYFR